MGLFDRGVEFFILLGVWVGVYLEWKNLQQKQQQRIKATVTRLLRTLGVNTK